MDNHRANQRYEEERQFYEGLPTLERRAICFLLDMSKEDVSRQQAWLNIFELSLVTSASDIFSRQKEKADRVAHSALHEGFELYPYLLRAIGYMRRNELVATFDGIEFAIVRLFGGLARPYVSSVFLASLTHPSDGSTVSNDPEAEKQIARALLHRDMGWGPHEPTFFPTWDFGSPLPIPPTGTNTLIARKPRSSW